MTKRALPEVWPPIIESGIPIPNRGHSDGYLVAAMRALAAAKIGDSLFIPDREIKSISTPALRVGQKGWYTASATTSGGAHGVRVWKIREPGEPHIPSRSRKVIQEGIDE